MLRRWPQASALPLQAPQRAFWSQALEILSRLTSKEAEPTAAQTPDDKEPETSRRASDWRPQIAADAQFPQLLEGASSSQMSEAKKAFSDLARHLRSSSDAAQLVQSWTVVKRCQPFVVEKDGVRPFDEAVDSKAKVLQMLPADVFAQRIAGSRSRTLFVGSTAAGENVTAANEAVVVALLVEYFHALKDHRSAIGLFESYNLGRLDWLNERSVPGTRTESLGGGSDTLASSWDAEEEQKRLGFVRATRLWAPARSAYLKALTAKNRYHKVVQFALEDTRNLETACESVPNMASLLMGCRREKDSLLARLAIETMAKRNPASVLPLRVYELAFKAAIRKKYRNELDVDNALWVAHKMRDDAGYVLPPDLWFALFNTSLHMKREGCALEIFTMYSNNFTSLHQDHFRRALRKACRLNHPDVVLAMVRQWLTAVDGDTRGVDAESKAKVLSFVLSEMMSSNHPVSTITEIIETMASSRIETGGGLLHRAVKLLLDDASESLSPSESIKNSLDFWKTHGPAVQNSVYLIHTLLHQCLERGWLDECELVVEEIVERGLPAVPCNSIVKVLDANEERGRFEDNVRMCQVLLKSPGSPGRKSLNQQFFECYMKALLCVGCFEEVRKQHTRLKLGKRFPLSSSIAVALRDAKAQCK